MSKGDPARIARQHARTSTLLGVDFVPVRSGASESLAPAKGETPAPTDKASRLDDLRARYERESPLVSSIPGWTNIVFGDGNPDAQLMFIGEAPGADEDAQGIPFVGRAGKKLNEMINAMGLERSDVYIANVLKVRPPDNRTPTPEEARADGPFLIEQIDIIQPSVIVTLGRPAANFLLENTASMGSMRGRWHEARGIPVMPTYHPAYLLRAYTPENRKKVWSELERALRALREG